MCGKIVGEYLCIADISLLIAHDIFFSQNDLVANMYAKANDVIRIFSDSSGTNPYAPGGDDQFQLPVNVKVLTDDSNSKSGISFDKHGQINVAFMNQVFDYINVGDSSGIDNTGSTPTLTENLKNQLIFAYSIGEDIDTEIEYYKECQDSEDYTDAQKEVCKKEKEKLQTLKDDLFEFGLERSSLDASVALFFGNKTTIGQVCAYANGLEEVIKPVDPDDWCQGGKVSVNDANVCCSSDCMQCGGLKPASDGSCPSGLCCTEGCCNDDFQEECETVTSVDCVIPSEISDRLVDDVPGFCCLDAPYESKDWGEKVRIKC